MPYTIVQDGDMYCLEKEGTGKKVKGSCHPNRADTEAMMKAMMANESKGNMTAQSDYMIDNYVATKPGDAYRLLPFGRMVKNGKARDITPELAAKFHLPHFKPPIKLGSHDETTPAGGFITGLEVRDDGLYAITEVTDKGAKTLTDGDYRYHSPEVIWEDSGYEDPNTGDIIPGPMIVGDALLHTPHLGEGAALYSIEPFRSNIMAEDTIEVPKSIFDVFTSWFKRNAEPVPDPVVEAPAPVIPEEYTAAVKERDELKAQIQAQKDAEVRRAHVENFSAQLKETKVVEGAEILASMTDEQAEFVVKQFKALSAQIKESALVGELGSTGDGLTDEDPVAKLNTVITAYAAEKKVDYNTARIAVQQAQPDLFKAAYPTPKKE